MSQNETSIGLSENIAGVLAYVLGFISGIIFLFIEKENESVRFHAAQSIVVFCALFILNIVISAIAGILAFGFLSFISMILSFIATLIGLITIILWIYLMFMAYKGNQTRLPAVAEIADKLL
ncbi:DUF4870 domain-containing protein [Methanohalobium sp.]|uniref:DUF4870 domain-containing protein n=1 Tax=Methanohalobium sp. TaxID=2837493 RepID=UPI0025FA5048|nr:hypothetical protein [Methanohalobium sp.]